MINKDLHRWSKYRSKLRDIPFDIQVEDIRVPNFCPILGIRLRQNPKYSGLDSPTLDRIDNEKGYVVGNIWVISNLANLMKSKATPEQLLDFASWVSKSYQTS